MVDDLQQLDEPDRDRPMDMSTVSRVHIAEVDAEATLRQLQQLDVTGGDAPMGWSTVSDVHIG